MTAELQRGVEVEKMQSSTFDHTWLCKQKRVNKCNNHNHNHQFCKIFFIRNECDVNHLMRCHLYVCTSRIINVSFNGLIRCFFLPSAWCSFLLSFLLDFYCVFFGLRALMCGHLFRSLFLFLCHVRNLQARNGILLHNSAHAINPCTANKSITNQPAFHPGLLISLSFFFLLIFLNPSQFHLFQ